MPSDKSRRSPSGPVSQFKTSVVMGAALVAGTATVTTFTMSVPGVRVGDIVCVNSYNALEAGTALCAARVSAVDVVECYVVNPTAAKVTIATMTLLVETLRAPIDGYIE